MGIGALITAASMAMRLALISEGLCLAAAFKIKGQLKWGAVVLLMVLIVPYRAGDAKHADPTEPGCQRQNDHWLNWPIQIKYSICGINNTYFLPTAE